MAAFVGLLQVRAPSETANALQTSAAKSTITGHHDGEPVNPESPAKRHLPSLAIICRHGAQRTSSSSENGSTKRLSRSFYRDLLPQRRGPVV